MSEGFWTEAVNHASYLVNMSPSTSIDLQIPQEIWLGVSVDYSTLRIFGCPAYSLVDSQKRNKLESKFKKCILIEFTKGVKSFRLWDPEKRNAFTSRDVIFDEESMLREKSEMVDKVQGGASDSSADTQEKEVEFSESPKRPEGSEEDSSNSDGDDQEATQEKSRPLRRSVRIKVPPTRYGWDDDHVSFALVIETGEPDSCRGAVETLDHGKWITAMEQEIDLCLEIKHEH